MGDPDLEGTGTNKAQFGRYKVALGNIIFTDYLRFWPTGTAKSFMRPASPK
jgi:hypothetical protein